MKILTSILILVYALSANAQSYGNFAGARSAGLGNATVALSDVWSAHSNQAALTEIKKPRLGFSYAQRYQIQDLNHGFLSGVLPTAVGHFGLAVRYFGFDLYNETKIGLSYARTFGSFLSAGIQGSVEQHNVSEGNTSSAIYGEVSLLAKPTKQLQIGFHLYNPTRSSLQTETEERLPTIGRLGASYTFREETLLTFEVEKQAEYKERYGLGVEMEFWKKTQLRAGMSLRKNNLTPTAGLGFRWQKIQIDAAWQSHPLLGSTLTYALSFTF